ncbi:hypothetical protein BJ508DRAFT_332179 [Ascobolus immersus RN42]|uniref:PH domain-containing protein n=1 Tax=Ascobolus immersus RN42 TaxID=1160509 RepID=A0A3N4HTQ2_ASCIM|nr:hypothetical protein BJ508DRAFT_332179 [Ascobolus immersus RN42]
MEQLEVPSRSYIIRWVPCQADHTISWSVKPHKKSLNFGIFRHPKGEATTGTPTLQPLAPTPTTSTPQRPVTRGGGERDKNQGDCVEKLHQAGLLDVYWHGKCEADKATTGTYRNKGGEGMFALVFDNTFSKQVAKTCTFISYTYPSHVPPPTNHHVPHYDTTGPTASQASLTSGPGVRHTASIESIHIEEDKDSTNFFTGILKKRKRKRHQGFARRFFSLDFTTSTLSYYLNRESSALRGAIPLSLAAISASEKELEICIDSGAEVWHLRALNPQDWRRWKESLERAARHAHSMKQHRDSRLLVPGTTGAPAIEGSTATGVHFAPLDERTWATIETLVGRVSGIRDSVRRLSEMPVSSAVPTPTTPANPDFALDPAGQSRRHFWKRRPLTNANSTPNLFPPNAAPSPSRPSISVALSGTAALGVQIAQAAGGGGGEDIQRHLDALLGDLNQVVDEFSVLIKENRHHNWHRKHEGHTGDDHEGHTHEERPGVSTGRHSMESSFSEAEFFDAEEGLDGSHSRVAVLNDSDNERPATGVSDDDDDSSSDEEESYNNTPTTFPDESTKSGEARDLSPLPLQPVQRRTMVPEQHVQPPSLIGFLRKNVGKDLSTIAMPVSANEPTSLLQRLAEMMEYTELLDHASSLLSSGGSADEALLYVTAFAITSFSYARLKERTLRKPFNPMLGETFEFVCPEKNFRFLAEKVCHRPVVMACHAEAPGWTVTQSPIPTQKFWGKSAELNTQGRVRIYFPGAAGSEGHAFSYTLATSFLRNIIAGEKYVEPVGTMTVHHESTGAKAIVTFKEGRMFSGRSEDLDVKAQHADGTPVALSLSGKWTESLSLLDGGKVVREIWRVGSALPNPGLHYGFTTFAAGLNEITAVEEGKLPPTDSRLRPDQRLVEEGRIDEAEEVKHQLEEGQRRRRKEMEEAGKEWEPRWFFKVGETSEEEHWRIRGGEGGYWECRKKAPEGWRGVGEVFERE